MTLRNKFFLANQKCFLKSDIKQHIKEGSLHLKTNQLSNFADTKKQQIC